MTASTTNEWRAGARALARRWGTTDLCAAEQPDESGRWLVSDLYALRVYDAGSVEAEALRIYRGTSGVPDGLGMSPQGVWPDGALTVRVWRSGQSVMAAARDLQKHVSGETMAKLLSSALDKATTVVDGLTEYEDDRDLLVARSVLGEPLAYFAPAVLNSVLDDNEVLIASTPTAPVVVIRDGLPVGLVMPTRVREVAA
jgi:hypothetical protein